MDRLAQHIRTALRGFLRTPSFTVTALVILAVGIGMAVAMFTVFDAVLVRRLPVGDQDRVVRLYTYRGDPKADYYLLREDLSKVAVTSKTMRDIAGVAHWGAPPAPLLDGDRPFVLNRTTVTGNFFDVLSAHAFLGRLLKPSDEIRGAPNVLVLSYGAWQKYFGGDSSIVGRRLMEPYLREPYEIVGVAPPGLDFPAGVAVWMPAWQPSEKLSVIAIARLAPGVTLRDAQFEFLGSMRRLFPDRKFEGVSIETFAHAVIGDVRPVLVMLAAAVALLLLIACVNVGNLLLLRAASRSRELSIRRALGASYWDIVRQLVIESLLLGCAGGALGMLTASALVNGLLVVAPRKLPRADVVSFAGTSMTIAIGVTLVAVLLFGVIPALLGSRGELGSPLRFDMRGGRETRARRDSRRLLVASQVALALVMLTGASLLGRSLGRLEKISLGYNPDRLSLLDVSFPPSESMDSALQFDQAKLYAIGERLLTAWRAVPGVAEVTPILVPPFLGSGVFVGRLDQEGQTSEEMKSNPIFPVEVGGAAFFRTFGIPIVRGRAFTDADRDRAEAVAIVSEGVARRMWPNENPIGKRIQYWGPDSAWRTIVGIAGDIHWRALRESTPSVYVPWRQSYWQGSFAIRTTGPLAAVLPALRRATRDANPALTLWESRSMAEVLDAPLAQPRLSALVLGGFAIVSLLLAATGLYGVMASAVRGKTRDLGVRAALGASPERLRRGVLGEALKVAGAGAVAGVVSAAAATRLLSTLLFDISPTDPLSFIGAAALLLLVALVAAYIPAHQATRVDPVETLRAD